MRYINPEEKIDPKTKRLNELMMDKDQQQIIDDLDNMTDADFAKKYPEMCEEYLTEEQILEMKPVYMYFL